MQRKDSLRKKSKEAPFLVFISFLVSFAVTRIYVYFLGNIGAAADIFPLEDYVLHHYIYGIVLLIAAGWVSIIYKDKNLHRMSALLYGTGLGIFFDEIGLLLTEFADYWAGITYSFVVVFSLILLNLIFFEDFWKEVGSGIGKFAKRHNLDHGPLALMGAVDLLNEVEEKMPETGRITAAFTGFILLVMGLLVILYPGLIRYWVGGAFALSGIAQIIQAVRGD